MIIKVKVKPKAKEDRVIEKDGLIEVWTKEKAKMGRANRAVISLLAEHFNVSKAKIRIKSGTKSREKFVEIMD